MSYEKLGLTNGTVLTAEHLNHIEDGIANVGGGGVQVVNIDSETMTCEKSAQEIIDIFENGDIVVLKFNTSYAIVQDLETTTPFVSTTIITTMGEIGLVIALTVLNDKTVQQSVSTITLTPMG